MPRRGGTREIVLLSLALVLLAAAGLFALRGCTDNEIPPEAARTLAFKCADCRAAFELTAAEMDQAARQMRSRSTAEDGGGVRCRSCGKHRAFRADAPAAKP